MFERCFREVQLLYQRCRKDVCTIIPTNPHITGLFTELAKKAKALNLDAIHDTVHEMARDEARHGKAFAGLLKRYFGK